MQDEIRGFNMAKSTIIKQLVNNEVSLTVVLNRIYVLADDIGNQEVKDWVSHELMGYPDKNQVPDYRVFTHCSLQYTGQNGTCLVNDYPLPPACLSQQTINEIEQHRINTPLFEIENNAKDIDGLRYIDRTYLAHEVHERSTDGILSIDCLAIRQVIPSTMFARIVNAISRIALDLLLELESVYGKLDDLDIGSEKINETDRKQLDENLNCIISCKKINVTNSNIGSGSNTATKSTELDTNVNVSFNGNKKKSSWLCKLFKKIKGC